jgi:hypothetical protein
VLQKIDIKPKADKEESRRKKKEKEDKEKAASESKALKVEVGGSRAGFAGPAAAWTSDGGCDVPVVETGVGKIKRRPHLSQRP